MYGLRAGFFGLVIFLSLCLVAIKADAKPGVDGYDFASRLYLLGPQIQPLLNIVLLFQQNSFFDYMGGNDYFATVCKCKNARTVLIIWRSELHHPCSRHEQSC